MTCNTRENDYFYIIIVVFIDKYLIDYGVISQKHFFEVCRICCVGQEN